MRISDWSSDVCSSDLRARGRLVRRDQYPDQHGARRRRLCRQRPQMVVERGRRSALQGRDPDGQDRHGGKPPHPAIDDDPRYGDAGRAYWTRTEEHTTELKSLMRISYAFLCLQKTTSQYTNYIISLTLLNT